ncbi:MFS transporter [Microbacterium oleivorans]|uniref:MFS transporter n=1 Tax=Microbacterium oleivorans TaxID=273677 RepID=A0A7D5EXB9_9MICO|nr:MFS transporter [Microbacterium oleivorans]QLD12471.1 MFS transporter [Microbacterium oleivorans]
MVARFSWWPLATVGLAQLMIVLDSTVVTIALPVMQQELGIGDGSRGWVITAYALAFGGLLLIGGRLTERLGLRRAFTVGLVGFAIASLCAGAAPTAELLFAGRAAQGVSAALLAPAALSIISTTYSEGAARRTAFGVFGALNGAGAAIGLLLGGLLTEYVSWRWCLLINLPIVLVALILTAVHIPASTTRRVRFDLVGAVTSVAAMTALVFALSEGSTFGWTSPVVIGSFIVAGLAMGGFILAHHLSSAPLLPFRIVLDRARGAAFLAIGLPQMALFGFYLVLTYWLQNVLGYPPLLAGAAFLPLAVAIVLGSTTLTASLSPRFGSWVLLSGSLISMAAGMLLLVGIDPAGADPFLVRFLPSQLLVGIGLGCSLSVAIPRATENVTPAESGVASAAVNTVTQLGGALGTALLNTIAAAVAAAALASAPAGASATAIATVAGFDTAMLVAAAILVATAFATSAIAPRRANRIVSQPVER